MDRAPSPEPGSRLAGLLRHLGEAAEREAAARARLTVALARLLDAPARADLAALLEVVLAACPSIDAICVLEREGAGWRVRAGVGHAPGAASPETALPPGTRAAREMALHDRSGAVLGTALFGSRSAEELPEEEVLLARVAAERAERVLEGERLTAELSLARENASRTTGFRDHILAIVGHDLRNPLGAIVMSAALLQKKGGLEGWQARTVDRVRGSALRMGRIIDDLLSYTRTRLGGGIPIARRPADLGAIAHRMVEELRAAHPEARVTIAAQGDLTGHWDPDRLDQVLSNLVSNAVDHGEEGQQVEVELRGEAAAVRLLVTNRGEMPRQALQHAFEAFHRGPDETTRKACGLGLGLYIAREIVRCHGGEIAVRCEDGATRMEVRLPRGAADPPAP